MALLRYTLLRLLILVVVGALLWLIWPEMPTLWLLLAAFFISGIISIFALNRTRDEVSAKLDRRVSTIKARLNERAAAEDAWDEAHRSAANGSDAAASTQDPESGVDKAEPHERGVDEPGRPAGPR